MIKNRVIYLTALLLSVLFLYFYGGKVPYMFFYVLILLPLASLVYTLIIFLRFKYVHKIDKKHVLKGEKANYVFDVINEDIILYPYIRVTFFGSETIFANQVKVRSFSLVPYRKTSFAFQLECRYRGVYSIGIRHIEFTDFLGIFRFRYKIRDLKEITVYPKIVYLDSFQLDPNFMSETHATLNTSFEDMTTMSDLRSYAYGDSMKRIHWKLSAKMNRLLVKNFQSTSQTNATLFLDLRSIQLPEEMRIIVEDKLIEAAVSVTYYCLSNWVPVDFVYYKDRIVSVKGSTPLDFEGIYRILSSISFDEKVSLCDVMDIYLKESIRNSNIILFTCHLDYDLYDEIYKAQFSGYDVSLIYVSSEELTGVKNPDADNIINFLPEIGVKAFKLDISDDLKTALEH